jgi:2-keto-4-pentenoate hydratase/2-oxohepta-3-ene-1,7-dioic acid hydratase in catechol pathway
MSGKRLDDIDIQFAVFHRGSRSNPRIVAKLTAVGNANYKCFYGQFISIKEIPDLQNINFHLLINGELRQKGNTSMMLFDFGSIIEYVSNFFTLKKGDLIFTGTPAGVGKVNIGDHLEAFIEDQKLLDFEIK